MRYERISDILKLATMLQGRADGLSIKDIMEEFHVSRRTAERMRDALTYVFPQFLKQTVWPLARGRVRRLISIS